MSPKNFRVPLLGACLVALALVAMPLGICPDMDNEFDVAARAEMGKQGREVPVAKAGTSVANSRSALQLAAAGKIVANGRLPLHLSYSVGAPT